MCAGNMVNYSDKRKKDQFSLLQKTMGRLGEPVIRKAMNIAIAKEKKMLEDLNIGLSEGAMKQLFPNVPFKNREEWGDILVKRDLTEAAQRLFIDKVDGAAQWYAVSPADLIKKRYASAGLNKGGTNTPLAERQAAKERGEKLKGYFVNKIFKTNELRK